MAGRNRSKKDRLLRRRRGAVKEARVQAAFEVLLISRPVDVTYLSGFTGDDSYLLVFRKGPPVLVTDGRFVEQARDECPGVEVSVRPGAMAAAVRKVLEDRGVGKLAVQADHLTLAGRRKLAEALEGMEVVEVDNVPVSSRAIKDAAELRAIRRAVSVAEGAFVELFNRGPKAFIGRSEQEVAAELDYLMRRQGASSPSFETIVAAGEHSSLPHYRPADRTIAPDEVVLIDWGAKVDGYCSDLTRVVATGKIPPSLAEAYALVLRAQKAGIGALKPGVSGKGADAAAREVLSAGGMGEAFVHGLGHGIGLEIHEAPALGRRNRRRLRSGMVVTVEPGVYLPGIGGIRIEDDVRITARGRQRLSSLPRELSAMTLRRGAKLRP